MIRTVESARTDLRDEVVDLLHRLTAADHLVGDAECLLQRLRLRRQLFEAADVLHRHRSDARDGGDQLEMQRIEHGACGSDVAR